MNNELPNEIHLAKSAQAVRELADKGMASA
jgi:hypothetical protein